MNLSAPPDASGETMPALPAEHIAARILLLRGHKVMLDADLAELYGVPTKVLLQAVKRNLERFPQDFMFQLSAEEFAALRSQLVTSKPGRGGRRYAPYAFTEQGVAMLSRCSTARAPSPCPRTAIHRYAEASPEGARERLGRRS